MRKSIDFGNSCANTAGIRTDAVGCPLADRVDVADFKGLTLEQLLRRPEIRLQDFESILRRHDLWPAPEISRAVEIDVRYEGYVRQQSRDAEKLARLSSRQIPR